jgi:hypothetical protein
MDKKEYMLQLHTLRDDNMNSAHIHCKLFGELDIVRVRKQQKRMKTQSKRVV